MISTQKLIAKITNELISFFFTLDATNISVQINEQDSQFELLLSCNYNVEKSDKLKDLSYYLQTNRQVEMEECYWELAGEGCKDFELALIGMMTDSFKMEINQNLLNLKLYKNKA